MENEMTQHIFISDAIKENYQNWGAGDIITITAPTGSGKSHFILYDFLCNYIIPRQGHLLYIVNRRVLQEQIQRELEEEVSFTIWQQHGIRINISDYITILTYQGIEKALTGENPWPMIDFIRSFTCVVYDECHYFYADSNFNTYTELSYDCLRFEFDEKLQIFISATMNNMEPIIKGHNPLHLYQVGDYVSYGLQYKILKGERIKPYRAKKSYEYLNLYQYGDLEQLSVIISERLKEKKEKWLIFIDAKDNGNKLQKLLLSRENKKQREALEDKIVLIDAEYEKREDASGSILELINKKSINKEVVITTPVMENGISFLDMGLRNIVIMSDVEETFIQMLGRKREDGEKVNLYLCKRDAGYFQKRYNNTRQILETYNRFWQTFNQILTRQVYDRNKNVEYIKVYPYLDLYYGNNVPGYVYFINYNRILCLQQKIMEEVVNYSHDCKNIGIFCYFVQGIIAANSFSIARLRTLKMYYKEMRDRLKIDQNAFIKEQVRWLGLSEDDVQEPKDIRTEYRDIIEQVLQTWLDGKQSVELSSKDNAKLKEEIRYQLLYFLEQDTSYQKIEGKDITQPGRSMSSDKFNRCMEKAGLKYRMEGRGTFILSVIE